MPWPLALSSGVNDGITAYNTTDFLKIKNKLFFTVPILSFFKTILSVFFKLMDNREL